MSDDLEKPYFTMKNLHVRFSELGSDPAMFSGYMQAIDTIMPGFLKIIEKAQNFDDLKKNVLDYTKEQIEFRNTIDYLRHDNDVEVEQLNSLPPALRPSFP